MELDNNKTIYHNFCKVNKALPLFYHDFWLDAVCGKDQWQVLISFDNENNVRAVWPVFIKKKFGIRAVINPLLTPYLGIWIAEDITNLKPEHKNSRVKAIYKELLSQVPNNLYFNVRFHTQCIDWQVFRWAGYMQKTKYTYIVPKQTSSAELWDNISSNTKNNIRKAQNDLLIKEIEDVDVFFNINKHVFDRQLIEIPYNLKFLKSIYDALKPFSWVKILGSYFGGTDIQGAVFLVRDQHTMYCLGIGIVPHAHRGALDLLLFEALSEANRNSLHFDFEGSDLPKIEPTFRGFGGILTPYHHIFKSYNRITDSFLTLVNKFG